jgi:hypothetical protein
MITRLALIATSAVVVGGLMTAPALAQTAPTITKVSAVGAEQATVSGNVDTATAAQGPVCYVVEFDTLADWTGPQDNVASTSPNCDLTPGTGVQPVSVQIGCFPAASCSADQVPLTPGSKYIAILSVQYAVGGTFNTSEQLDSAQASFTTKPLGSLKLTSGTVKVTHRTAAFALDCASAQACQGTIEVTVHHKACISGNISMRAGRKATLNESVKGKCLKSITAAGAAGLSGKLVIVVTTDQHVSLRPVTLLLA